MTRVNGFPLRAALATVLAAAFVGASPAWASVQAATAKPDQAGAKGKGPGGGSTNTVSAGTGIVQAVGPVALVVRQLDGSIVRVIVGPGTRVFVNGVRSSFAKIRPGFVVEFAGSGKVARVVRAQGSAPRKAGPTVASVSADTVVVTTAAGNTVTISVDARTRVFVDGVRVTLADVRVGDVVVTASRGRGPTPVLRLRRPG